MAESKGNLFLQDAEGNYYVVSAEMLEQVKVPADKKEEVEEVIGGKVDVQGFDFNSFATQSFTPTAQSGILGGLRPLAVCNGRCGKTFGVLGTQFRTR